MANYDKLLRQMLGRGGWSTGADLEYHVQTILNNMSLLSEQLLGKLNKVVMEHGHAELTKKA